MQDHDGPPGRGHGANRRERRPGREEGERGYAARRQTMPSGRVTLSRYRRYISPVGR